MAWAYRAASFATTGSVSLSGPHILLGAATSVGDRIVVCVFSNNSTFFDVHDDLNSGSYHEDAFVVNGTQRFAIQSMVVTVAGTPNITAFGTGNGGFSAVAYSGLGSGLDVVSSGVGTSLSTSSGATPATHAANQLVVGAWADYGWNRVFTAGAGFTLRGKHDLDGGTYEGALEDMDSGASGTPQTATGTLSSGSNFWASCCAVYPVGAPSGPPCQYGTRLKPGQPAVAIIDQALIQTALTLIPGTWLGLLLNIYIGTAQDTSALCGSLPLEPAQIATNMLINPGRAALEVLQRVLWPYFCECTPGASTPVSPPPYAPVQPPGWPAAPTYPVNPTNPCLDLTEVRAKLDQLLRIAGEDLELDTLLQRWRLPFATVDGTTHTGLSGTGEFATERTLGLLVTVTGLPPGIATWPGNPTYLKDLGWIAVDDGGAMLQELRVTRQQQTWYPAHMQLATRVSWSLTPDTEIAVQELKTEA